MFVLLVMDKFVLESISVRLQNLQTYMTSIVSSLKCLYRSVFIEWRVWVNYKIWW